MAIKICKVCGKEFNGISNSKYCSSECRDKFNSCNNETNMINITRLRRIKAQNTRKKNNNRKQTDSICWTCANASNSGCSWSISFTPVEGWEVKIYKVKRSINGAIVDTDAYKVVKCPLYKPDARHKKINY